MEVGRVGGTGGWTLASAVSFHTRRSPPVDGTQAGGGAAEVKDLLRKLDDLVEILEQGRRASRVVSTAARSRGLAPYAWAGSTSALGLPAAGTYTVVRSTEEVNATPTSYAPKGPTWAGGSTAQPSVGGTYQPSPGDPAEDTLTFQGSSNGQRVRVYDGSGVQTDVLDLKGQPPGTVYTLSNRLTVSFSAGTIQNNDTFQVSVSAAVGSAVDPNASFDAAGDDAPGFEAGRTVGAGSFFVNGVEIEVAADDSIRSVLGKITASAAGVAARFDADAERVVLQQKTPGAGHPIALGSDTNGFFDAVKLSGAASSSENLTGADHPLGQTAGLSGVTSGTLTVNGVAVAVDPLADSLKDVLARLERAGAGVRAYYEAGSDTVRVAATRRGEALELADGVTGFFSALGIETGSHVPEAADTARVADHRFVRPGELSRRLREVADGLEKLLGASAGSEEVASVLEDLRGGLREALAGVLQRVGAHPGRRVLRSGLGVDVAFDARNGAALRLDDARLADALHARAGALSEFLQGAGEEEGLWSALEGALREGREELVSALASLEAQGLLVDLTA